MGAKGVIAGAHGEAHEPMIEGGFAAKAAQLMKSLGPDFLHDVLNFAFAARIAADGGEEARRILPDERLKTSDLAFEHRRDQLRIGWLHSSENSTSARGRKRKAGPRTSCPLTTPYN